MVNNFMSFHLIFLNKNKRKITMSENSFNADPITNINDNLNNINISVVDFGTFQCNDKVELVKQITFHTQNSMDVQIITYGATLTSIKIPNGNAYWVDILLGYDTLEKYLNMENPRLGSIVNFSNKHKFDANSMDTIDENSDGSLDCLSCVNWEYFIKESTLFLTRLHRNALITCSIQVTNDNSIRICLGATGSSISLINLSPNLYFNLNGHDMDCRGLYQQKLVLNADQYLAVEETDRRLLPVGGTEFDLRIPHRIGSFLRKLNCFGFNHDFVLTGDLTESPSPFVCRLSESISGAFMEIYSNGSIVQINSANDWPIGQHNISLERPMSCAFDCELKLRSRFLLDRLNHVDLNKSASSDSTAIERIDRMKYLNKFDLLNDSLSSIYSCQSAASTISSIGCDCKNSRAKKHGDSSDADLEEEIIEESDLFNRSGDIEQRVPPPSSCSDISLIDSELRGDNSNRHLIGKDGVPYKKHGGIGIAVLKFLNEQNCIFDKNALQPGNVFRHEIIYKFGIDSKWK